MAGFLFIGWLMGTKGYGSPPSLAPGQSCRSGWLTVRKHHLGVASDTFIEPVELINAMSWAGTRVSCANTWQVDACVFNIVSSRRCASITDLFHLGLFRAPAECLTSAVLRNAVWIFSSLTLLHKLHTNLLQQSKSRREIQTCCRLFGFRPATLCP